VTREGTSVREASVVPRERKADKRTSRWLYFVEHRGNGVLRVGTCTIPEEQFASEHAGDWEVRKFRGPMPAKSALKLERRITEMLRGRGVDASSETGTEESHTSWSREAFPAKSLKKLIKQADDDAT